MQNTFLASIFISLLIIAFNKEKDVKIPVGPTSVTIESQLDTNKWFLKKIYQDSSVQEVTKRKAFIRFNEAKASAGGNGSCNSFGSTMKLDGNKISFSNIFSTKMFCAEVQSIENSFLSQLANVTRYEMRDKSLVLFNNEKKVLEFEL
jgi:heat shock protein HslJ